MKLPPPVRRCLQKLHLPLGLIMVFLQRTPGVRIVTSAVEFVLASPVGNVLKSSLATAAALGTVNSLAGATELSTSTPSPAQLTVGTNTNIAFAAIGAIGDATSWNISGSLPPGLTFQGGRTTGTINAGTLTLSGIPTTAGNYSINLVGRYDPLNLNSPLFSYSFNVTGPANVAPGITTQPQSQVVTVGANVTFTGGASGTPEPTLQWQKNGNNIGGATGTTLTLNNVQEGDAGNYTLVATNGSGSATSNAATLTVNPPPSPPAFTVQPGSQTVIAGNPVTFTAAADGNPAPSFQWRKDGVNIGGATNSTFSIGNTALGDAGTYTVVASNSSGAVASNGAVLTVNPATFAPTIGTEPQSQTIVVGNPVTFTVAANGNPAPTFQWRKDGVNIGGAANSSYMIASVTLADAATYSVVVSNNLGNATSIGAVLTVHELPAITLHPQGQTVTAGGPVTFTAAASGTPAPTFQWRKDGVNIGGATNSTYTIATTVAADAGTYTVVATNAAGSATSNGAVLAINTAPAITTQPQSQTIIAGNPVTFIAAASGNPAPTFQWKKDGVNIGGATNSTFTIATVALADAATYTVVATNIINNATSNGAVLTVHVAPAISTQPQNQTIIAGNPVTFTAAASGTPAPTFQWLKNGVNIPGATNANYTIPNVARADAGNYGVVATNVVGSAFSNAATLAVQYVPVFTSQPVTHFVTVGANVTLTVTTDANPAATYQWKKSNVDIPGAINASYTINNAQLGDTASYTVVATNVAGPATSNAGVLTVTVASLTPVPADFNNDGKPDIVWRNINTGAIAFWFMNGTAFQSATVIGAITNDWSIAGTGDFNNDGQTDLLWRKASTGAVAVWLMNGTAMQSAPLLANITADWRIDGTGDFNGDGKVDILWRKESSGAVALWLMDGVVIQSTPLLGNITADWLIGGTGDFNGDGKVDILWRKESTGAVAFWLMNGLAIQSTPVVANITADWKIAGSGDYNADGETDILWRKESTGLVAFWLMNDTAIQTTPVVATITADWVICN